MTHPHEVPPRDAAGPAAVRGLTGAGCAWGAAVATVVVVALALVPAPSPDGEGSRFPDLGWLVLGVPVAAVTGALLGALVGGCVQVTATRVCADVTDAGRVSLVRVQRACGATAAVVAGLAMAGLLFLLGQATGVRPATLLAFAVATAGLASVAGLLAAYQGPRSVRRSGIALDAPVTGRRWMPRAAAVVLAVTLVAWGLLVRTDRVEDGPGAWRPGAVPVSGTTERAPADHPT